MAYRIEGLSPAPFAPLFALDEAGLAARGARRLRADAPTGYPCRISLRDAGEGDSLLLLHHVSHDVDGPFRSAYAIYVREGAERASYRDEVPAMLSRRALGLRAFDREGMLCGALLALPGEAEARIAALLAREEVAQIHAHNAAQGCFLARIVRD